VCYEVPTPKSDVRYKTHHDVLKVRRIWSDGNRYVVRTTVDIMSDFLRGALFDIFKGAQVGVDGFKQRSSELMLHARPGLQELLEKEKCKPNPNKELVEDLSVACQYIAEEFGSTMETLASLATDDQITFDLLWTLFPPKALLYTEDTPLGEGQLYQQWTEVENTEDGYIMLRVRNISYDGRLAGWVTGIFAIKKFEGAKMILSLPIFPISWHPEQDEIMRSMVQRGKRYTKLLQAHQEYQGLGKRPAKLLQANYHEYEGFALADDESRMSANKLEYDRYLVQVSIPDSATILLQARC
jgi:hypothetical protein